MPDDFSKDLLPTHGEAIDPVEMARRDQRKALPKRFYETAGVDERDGLFVLVLDGRPALTPARALIALPTRAAAEAVADEWNAQDDEIDPAKMPMTRLVNSALDGVTRQRAATAAEIVKFAGSDLVCYRAGEPHSLVIEQARAWNPVLDFVREKLGARFVLAEGVVFAAQPAEAVAAVAAAVEAAAAGPGGVFRLAALNLMTSLTGSALIALAVALGGLSAAEGWRAAHVDEDFQIRAWGADAEAADRRARRWKDMNAAARLYALSLDPD